MPVEFSIQSDAAEKIRQRAGAELESARANLVREAMINVLQTTIERNPVDTGRSRAAWANSLEELGGSPPAGWEGPHPSGIEVGRQLGMLSVNEAAGSTQAAATNAVNYVSALEYGTSRKSPFAMVRAALRQVAVRLPEWFRF